MSKGGCKRWCRAQSRNKAEEAQDDAPPLLIAEQKKAALNKSDSDLVLHDVQTDDLVKGVKGTASSVAGEQLGFPALEVDSGQPEAPQRRTFKGRSVAGTEKRRARSIAYTARLRQEAANGSS